jgi:hypothetical protein
MWYFDNILDDAFGRGNGMYDSIVKANEIEVHRGDKCRE